ncbi:hypothetical protein L950_0218110 [Sphingobacterium sp. IITKGP-BTPF85]|nr:hypothetical protein L950_0218110 [Sphingobacterium sp. IITKGP-BTPF85]
MNAFIQISSKLKNIFQFEQKKLLNREAFYPYYILNLSLMRNTDNEPSSIKTPANNIP